ncbi:inositol 4-methyltransferase-like [Syzygium oleosum]|uniref:inositol 4-methyltransferase-like n=1 Tax=Syzygium oleosum TaxID=219896 RepID=UPI0011D21C40|nr:inositol 4-methyltransferase-like [Syzygium oleosum]
MANIQGREGRDQEEEVGKLAFQLAGAMVFPMVLKSALELNIIDSLVSAGGFLSPAEIASRVGAKNPEAPVMVDRMMRYLVSHSVIKWRARRSDGEGDEDGDGGEREYGAGPMCRFLAKDEEGGAVGPMFLLLHDRVFMESWYHLNDVIMDGGVPFERAHGMTAFEYTAIDDRFNRVFNRAMSSQTTMIMKKILDVYGGFEGVKVLVDVGGGVGVTLKMITSKHPHIKGINFDLPHVLADAPSYPGVEHVGGDMFESVPRGDAIFMKWILHDWSDEHCSKLLKNCYEALPTDGKVIIVESILPVVPEGNVSANIVFEKDLFLLAQTPGGKERTQNEFEALAVQAGFTGCEVKFCAYNSWVMEFPKTAGHQVF